MTSLHNNFWYIANTSAIIITTNILDPIGLTYHKNVNSLIIAASQKSKQKLISFSVTL